jgi:hypothetical protein
MFTGIFPEVACFFGKGGETRRYSADASLFRIRFVFLAVARCALVFIVVGIFSLGGFPVVACFFDQGER